MNIVKTGKEMRIMRTKLAIITLVLVLLPALVATPVTAMSGGAVLDFTVGCDSFTVTFTDILFDRDNTGTGLEIYEFEIVDGKGNQLVFFEDFAPVGSITLGATETYTYNIAPIANPINLLFMSDLGNGLSSETLWGLEGDCPDLPPSNPPSAIGIPAGFVFATIVCDTPVYNTPAGQPVGNAAITNGQTWYVNPEPVNCTDGQQWTEIFVSSTTHPWIPTSCVA
jgi:hypothetical protein